MLDCLLDGFIDTLKLLPYLFVTFLILEYIEHKMSKKSEKTLEKYNKFGPIVGGVFGALPQCGFSTMASQLYSNRVITVGTLIAIFLSTSDEMLPIMISEKANIGSLLLILLFKVVIGITFGFIIDLIIKRKVEKPSEEIHNHCACEECHCKEQGIFLSSIIHTLKVAFFILIVNIVLNSIIYFIGEDKLSNLLLNKNIFTYFVASLIGLIPNCASSVIITELYLTNIISIGTLFSGLLTGSGLGILVLFKENKNKKENIMILLSIYFIGVIVGFLIDLVL